MFSSCQVYKWIKSCSSGLNEDQSNQFSTYFNMCVYTCVCSFRCAAQPKARVCAASCWRGRHRDPESHGGGDSGLGRRATSSSRVVKKEKIHRL